MTTIRSASSGAARSADGQHRLLPLLHLGFQQPLRPIPCMDDYVLLYSLASLSPTSTCRHPTSETTTTHTQPCAAQAARDIKLKRAHSFGLSFLLLKYTHAPPPAPPEGTTHHAPSRTKRMAMANDKTRRKKIHAERPPSSYWPGGPSTHILRRDHTARRRSRRPRSRLSSKNFRHG